MKIAIVYDGKIGQVMEVNNLTQLPRSFTFRKKGQQITVPVNQVELLQTNYNTQPGDKYIPGKGIYRPVGK